jgi:hypothetical protein
MAKRPPRYVIAIHECVDAAATLRPEVRVATVKRNAELRLSSSARRARTPAVAMWPKKSLLHSPWLREGYEWFMESAIGVQRLAPHRADSLELSGAGFVHQRPVVTSS